MISKKFNHFDFSQQLLSQNIARPTLNHFRGLTRSDNEGVHVLKFVSLIVHYMKNANLRHESYHPLRIERQCVPNYLVSYRDKKYFFMSI